MNATEIILYVCDQARARRFYAEVLCDAPTLDVEGMTAFELGGVTLGLMPADDIAGLVNGIAPGSGQRCELYLRRPDAAAVLARVEMAGGRVLDGLALRPWGESVGYALDPDGHVLAVAVLADSRD